MKNVSHMLALAAVLSSVAFSASAQIIIPATPESFQVASGRTSTDYAYDRAETQVAYLERQLAIVDSNDDDDDNDDRVYMQITRGDRNLDSVRYVVVAPTPQLRTHPAYGDLKDRVYNLRQEYISRGLPVGTYADWNYDGYTLTPTQKQAINRIEMTSKQIGNSLSDTAQAYSIALDNRIDALEAQLNEPVYNTRELEGFRVKYMTPQIESYRDMNREKRVGYIQSGLNQLNRDMMNLTTGTEQELQRISTDIRNTLAALDRMDNDDVDTTQYTFRFYPDSRVIAYGDIRNELEKIDYSPMDYKRDQYLPH